MTFNALVLQMGHELKDILHDYWSRQTATHCFCGETMIRDRLLTTLQLLHFADNSQRPDKGREYNRLWKLSTVSDTLNVAYAKFYNLSEHLAVDKVIAEFKNKIIFRLTFQRKENALASKFTNFVMNQGIHIT
jgi:hypothetical protein